MSAMFANGPFPSFSSAYFAVLLVFQTGYDESVRLQSTDIPSTVLQSSAETAIIVYYTINVYIGLKWGFLKC